MYGVFESRDQGRSTTYSVLASATYYVLEYLLLIIGTKFLKYYFLKKYYINNSTIKF